MADKRHMCLLGRIILCALLTGISGAEVTQVFFSSAEDVRLSCNNALSGCTSTTWNYNRPSGTVELIALGIKKTDTERHERLSLGSDCSLNIKKVTKEDRGEYTCRQYVNKTHYGADARVFLHVLHVSSSSSQSEIRSGRSLTLFCQLYYDDLVSCDILVHSEGLDLIWVNQAGVNLQTDSRFQISFSSEQCNISLTTTLLNEDHNREWRCQLKHRDQLKTSATYTVKYPTPSETNPPSPVTSSKSASAPTQAASADSTLIPVSSSNSEKKSSQTTAASTEQEKQTPQTPETTATQRVIVSIVEIAVFAAPTVILLQIICARRAGRKNSSPK
ncbi:obscurin-like isoform X1 [Carassius auratus]|uniref:Obscurin-like isoform X1 n=1 Tax=Carassius auratus TaxID=7957 RepID=A0A6P6LLV5_CARAU|nr:obscurin-like isoform X1 [Carassius auratus]